MCIIAAKPAGKAMPTTETIRRMWYANRDGAGFMYAADGKVRIEKGFMKLSDFEAAIKRVGNDRDLTKTAVVLHFRITTHGGTCPANCHPFPVTRSIKNLQALTSSATMGVAHNGIIPNRPRFGISDTMEYIATQLAPLYSALPGFTHNDNALELIENAIQSKMCLLSGDGEITTIGNFICDGGILYSNTSYRGYQYTSPRTSSKTASKSGKGKKKASTPPREKKPLQWAYSLPNGCFAYNHDTHECLDDLSDILIDENGKAYLFDNFKDGARLWPDMRLYTAEGLSAQFDPDLADLEYVIDDETDLPFRFI